MKMILAGFILFAVSAEAARIKDIANVRGVRENQLIGYGLVVGLNGTGDNKTEYTSASFARMLETLGVKLQNKDYDGKNIAAVIVTATLPPFGRAGNKVDVTVNSIGSATSLQGGTLLQTPLRGADQQVYAVAQGTVLVSTPSSNQQAAGQAAGAIGGAAAGTEKPHLTIGKVSNGAMIETDMPSDFTNRRMFRLTLQNPDFTSAARMVKVINEDLGGKYASAKDSGTIDVITPASYESSPIELLANLENLDVTTDSKAKVVINEKTGTVVIGEHVQISTIALSHGSLNIQVNEPAKVAKAPVQQPLAVPNVEQNAPNALTPQAPLDVRGPASVGALAAPNVVAPVAAPGRTPAAAQAAQTSKKSITILKKSASVGDLVKALNSLGVTPKDLIGILQAIKSAGALNGELEVL